MSVNRKVKGVWIPIAIWEMKVDGMLPIHRCIYAEIDSLSKPGDPCRVSNPYLARFFQVSPSTVKRAISFLYANKLIKIWYEADGSQKRRMLPSYLVQNDPAPVQNELGVAQNDPALGQNELHRIPLENHLEYHEGVSEKKLQMVADDGGLENTYRVSSPQVARRPPSAPGSGKRKSGGKKVARHFEDTAYWDYEVFEVGFSGSDYETADLRYYHEKLKAWSAEGHKKKDWLAVARMFMLNDRRDNKLVLKNQKSKKNGTQIVDFEQARRVAKLGANRRNR